MPHDVDCLVCGQPLTYPPAQEARSCAICGAKVAANAWCTAGHFVCDGCHGASAMDLVAATCLASTTRDPVQLAQQLMHSPLFHMHGPEHHFLVPAVLVAAYCSARELPISERKALLAEARRRAEVVKGGFCGLWGACGAGVGTGIFVSLVTGSTPLATKPWKLANAMTSAALGRIASHGGPRCCKRCSFLAITEAAAFIGDHLGTKLDLPRELLCQFHAKNRECTREACPFYPGAAT